MKKFFSLFLILIMVVALGGSSVFAKESDISELQQLIDTGKAITDSKSAQAFVWVNNVLKYIENHTDSYVYNDIKNEATEAKGYTSIDTFNKHNIILGYLDYLKDELNGINDKNVQELIDESKLIKNDKGPEAYKWLIEVIHSMDQYGDYSISKDINTEVAEAKGYTSIDTFNKHNIILGYLDYLKDELNGINDKNVQELIDESKLIKNDKGPEAYKWLIEVINSMNQYGDYSISKDINKEATEAKGYTSIDTFNKFNIIVGYLTFLQEKIESSSEKISCEKINELIEIGNSIADWSSSEAYKWLMDVYEFNNAFSDTSIYESLNEHCKTSMGYSSISTFNMNNIILADLSLMKEEITTSIIFTGIEIKTLPNKTTYNEGDFFNTKGMIVNAIYTYIYEDDSTSEKRIEITDYCVDTSTPLTLDDEEWVVSYTEDDVTKSVAIPITVNPVVVSETLKSIEVSKEPNKTVYKEGETFSKVGMRIDATYDQEWSDGTHSSVKKENVSYYVDTKKVLTASDTSVTITVTDGDVSLSIEQGITVETYMISKLLDSITVVKNPNKLSYKSGEFFDKSGMIINAKYKCEWSNGYVGYIVNDNIKNYSVNTTTPLVVSDKKVTVTFIDGGIKKTVDIPINVVSQYNNEWVDGNWYGDNGSQMYSGKLLWKSNATGWWVEDTDGWYPVNQWQKIDGVWYFFKPDGYMAMNEYYNGYWFNADGSWDDKYLLSWKSNSSGWWVEDISGWWPSGSWLKIDGYWYYFDESGYMVTSQYIDGWWIGYDGICR